MLASLYLLELLKEHTGLRAIRSMSVLEYKQTFRSTQSARVSNTMWVDLLEPAITCH